ncbi:nose resistant to fluoxetine protein 6-like isoform X1 [Mizuhopecten yessoensis]|nr:nose resistant to fluoxetine protein 6-like isoform X1 [Mizuhopecten yessoensis]
MALVSILLVLFCAAEVHGGQSTNAPPLTSHELLDFLQQALKLFPDAITLEDLLNTMSLAPTMDEKSLTTIFQGANIDMSDPSQISNVLIVLKGLYSLTSWGYSKLPNGNINDLYNMLSKMDEQSLKLLLRDLNIDQLNSSQYGDALTFLQALQDSVGDGGENVKPPTGDIADLLKMLSTLDEQSLKLLLQGFNIDGGALSFLTGALSGGSLNSMDFSTLSPGCSAALDVLVVEVKEQKTWALKMIDAWGKPPSGILTGNTHMRGSFDQCLAVQPEIEKGTPFATTFCVAGNMEPLLGMSIGMCVPRICTDSDVYNLTNAMVAFIPLNEPPNINHLQCQREIEYDTPAIAAICVCCFFLAMISVATMFDMCIVSPEIERTAKPVVEVQDDASKTKNGFSHISTAEVGNIPQHLDVERNTKNGHIQTNGISPGSVYKLHDNTVHPNNEMSQKYSGMCAKLVLSFSAWTNVRRLLRADQAGTGLGSIHGIRFFSVTWILLGHTFLFAVRSSFVVNRVSFFDELLHRRSFTMVNNAYLSVDSFFAISGVLVSYLFMKEMKREKGRINWFMFYFHRFLRLTPTYMIVLMLNAALFHYVSDIPYRVPKPVDGQFCETKWWTNLLYVNNIFKNGEACLDWTWYLANDMQFYVVSPLLLVPLYFWKKIGGAICAICLLGVTAASAGISVYYKLPAVAYSNSKSSYFRWEEYMDNYYTKPYCRMGPYIVGIVTGFILYRTGGKYKIKMPLNLFIWVCMASLACIVTFGIYEESIGNAMSVEIAALYNAVHRTLWGVCVCWVVFACVTGNGGYVNTLLSWSPFVPLGRLSYCVYLVHPLVINAYYMSRRQGVYGTDAEVIYIFLGNLIMSYMVAIVLCLAVESPLMALEKTILRKDKKTN